MAKVVILGGGFGGLAGATTLREQLADEHEITLVARSDRFFMGFAKLWDLGGIRPLDDGTGSLDALERRGVRFVRADVNAIDPESRSVETSVGSFEADSMLVALGAAASPKHLEMLTGDAAHNLYDADELPAMRDALDQIEGGRVLVAILGGPFLCPPAPFEAVLLVDEVLRRRGVRDQVEVAISTPMPMTLPVAGPDASRYVADHLGERGIELLSQHAVVGVDGTGRTVSFENGAEVNYDLLLGVPASVPPPVVAESPLAAGSGWIEPDRHTLRTAFDRVYAVGDCTMIPTAKGQLPKAGVFAAGEAEVAARNIASDLVGSDPASFDGHGYCFLELPGERVAFVEGNFYAEPEPDVEITEASEEQFRKKQAFERERLERWLG